MNTEAAALKPQEREEHRQWAEKNLADLRQGNFTSDLEGVLADLDSNIRFSGLTLADFGSSLEEIEKFEVAYHRRRAEELLEGIRQHGRETEFYQLSQNGQELLSELEKANLQMEDICTSMEELLRLGVDRNIF